MDFSFLTNGIQRTPYKHQLDAVEFFHTRKDGNLFFEMGTGKTGTAVMIYRNWCTKQSRLLRCLVVCPPVVLHNWKDEFKLFSKIPDNKIVPLVKGTAKNKAELVYEYVIPDHEGKILITNYEALLSDDLFKAIDTWNPEVIIYDEAHYLKNSGAKRSKVCLKLAEKAQYRLGLTGTPILGKSLDVFGIFKVIDTGRTFGTNKFIFQNKYMIDMNARNPHLNFPKWQDRMETYPELQSKIYAKSLRKLKSECLDLPDLIRMVRYAEWGTKQKKAYEDLKRDFLAFIETRKKMGEPATVTANLAVTKAMRMLQVASGFVMTDEGDTHEFDSVPKLDLLHELLEEVVVEGKQKCIVWCAYKQNYTMVSRVCDKLGIKHVFLTGEQNTTQKRESEVAFQTDPDTQVIIANMAAGGVGVNLTAASHSIVYSRSFSLAHHLQSEARNHRGGSEIHEKIVKVDLAIQKSLDEVAMSALNNKLQISTEILDIIKGE